MPVEPPVESPATLDAALDLLAENGGDGWRPLAGGTDLMVQITAETGRRPTASSICGISTSCVASSSTATA